MKVLVLSITAGQGHNATAKALCSYLEQLGIESTMLDTYNYLNRLLGETVSKGYLITASKAKLVYSGVYRLAEKRHKSTTKLSPTRLTNQFLSRKLKRFIDHYDPDVIICTHIFAGILIDVLQEKRRLRAKTIGILTDFAFHPFWEESLRCDYVVIPNELIACQARKKGFKDSQIIPVGIPIHPKFANSISKEEAKLQLGLNPALRTILMMSGSMGYGHMETTIEALDELSLDFQMIVVCGNNAEAKAKIDQKQTKKRILNLGYVDYVDVLMDASDCIITKPGGLTTSEALAKKLPLLIVNPIPGQEDRNTEFLLNNGVAMAISDTCPIDEIIYQLFYNPERLAVMQEAISLIRKPNSTRDICEITKRLCEESDDIL